MFGLRADWLRRMRATLDDDACRPTDLSVEDIPVDSHSRYQSVFHRLVSGEFGPSVMTRSEALALGGHRDTRDFASVSGHPIWRLVRREAAANRGCVPFPFAISDDEQSLHDGFDDNPLLKAAVEQFRRDTLEEGFSAWLSAGPLLEPRCTCETLVPSDWPFGSFIPSGCRATFDAALRWLHVHHPGHRYVGSRLDVGAWKALLARDPNPLWAAIVFYQIGHGAVICPVPSRVSVLKPRPPRPDDPMAEVLWASLLDGVASGDYLLWDRVQEMHPELRGRSPVCVNERFVLDQGNKYRGEVKYRPIINMKKQSNRYCVSRGCYYPRIRDHIRRLIVDGEEREQY